MCKLTDADYKALVGEDLDPELAFDHYAMLFDQIAEAQRGRILAALQEAYAEAEGIDIEAAAQFNEIIKMLVDD